MTFCGQEESSALVYSGGHLLVSVLHSLVLTRVRERSWNKCHSLGYCCIFFSYFGAILGEKDLENELPRKMML